MFWNIIMKIYEKIENECFFFFGHCSSGMHLRVFQSRTSPSLHMQDNEHAITVHKSGLGFSQLGSHPLHLRDLVSYRSFSGHFGHSAREMHFLRLSSMSGLGTLPSRQTHPIGHWAKCKPIFVFQTYAPQWLYLAKYVTNLVNLHIIRLLRL